MYEIGRQLTEVETQDPMAKGDNDADENVALDVERPATKMRRYRQRMLILVRATRSAYRYSSMKSKAAH